MDLTLVPSLTQSFKKFCEGDVKGGELVSSASLSSNGGATSNNGQFNGQCRALVTGM